MTDLLQPFELQVGGPNGIDNADVPVRWCITPEFVAQMDEDGLVDPHIVLVTIHPNTGEMSRHLAPVGNLLEYVRFTKAGDMRLFGWIVDGRDGRKNLHKRFMAKDGGQWNTTLVGYGHEPVQDIEGAYESTTRIVTIPDSVFGKEPPAWLKWYANLWHSGRPHDQCHFRRRVLLGIPKLLPFVLITLLSVAEKVLIGAIFWAGGFGHSVNWRFAWRPYKYPLAMLLEQDEMGKRKDFQNHPQRAVDFNEMNYWLGNRYLWWRKDRDNHNVLGVFFLPFTPLLVLFYFWVAISTQPGLYEAIMGVFFTLYVLCLVAGLVDLVINTITVLADYGKEIGTWLSNSLVGGPLRMVSRRWHQLDMHLAETNRWPAVILLVVLGIIVWITWLMILTWIVSKWLLAFVILTGIWIYAYVKLFSWWDARQVDLNDPMSMRELLCSRDQLNMTASYSALPWDHRSIGVTFKALKNRVCRPMQM